MMITACKYYLIEEQLPTKESWVSFRRIHFVQPRVVYEPKDHVVKKQRVFYVGPAHQHTCGTSTNSHTQWAYVSTTACTRNVWWAPVCLARIGFAGTFLVRFHEVCSSGDLVGTSVSPGVTDQYTGSDFHFRIAFGRRKL